MDTQVDGSCHRSAVLFDGGGLFIGDYTTRGFYPRLYSSAPTELLDRMGTDKGAP